jgi:hypothetical protein
MRFTQLLYCKEQRDAVELSWEYADKTGRNRFLYVPKESQWRRDMPAWAKELKAEIVPRIVSLGQARGIRFIVNE